MTTSAEPDGNAAGDERERAFLHADVRAFFDDLEAVADKWGRRLADLDLVGCVELQFSQHGYVNARLIPYFKPSRLVRHRRLRRAQETARDGAART